MPENNQKKIACVYISAFLEATLHEKYEYLALFRDWRSGINWLPQTIYLNQYADSYCHYVCSFEEDIDLTTTTIKKGSIMMNSLTVWKERMVPLKWGQQDTRAVFTGWNMEEKDSLTGSYNITFELEDEINPGLNDYIIFSMAESKESSNPYPSEKNSKNQKVDNNTIKDEVEISMNTVSVNKKNVVIEKDKKGKKEEEKVVDSLDLSIVLVDTNRNVTQLPLSHYSFLQQQLEVKIMKADFMTKNAKSEIVFQTFFFPIRDFIDINPLFNPMAVTEIKFVFDKTTKGVVVIDDIGFRKGCSE